MQATLKQLEARKARKKQLLAFLETLPEQRMIYCTRQIVQTDISFSCLNCSDDPNFVLCRECFSKSEHRDHLWYSRYATFGYCDCGDETTIKHGCSCTEHYSYLRVYLDAAYFEELLLLSKHILYNLENDILAFDLPVNLHLYDCLAICSIYGNSDYTIAYMYALYQNALQLPVLSAADAVNSFFGKFAAKRVVSSYETAFYGSLMASNRYFRIHASYVVCAYGKKILDIYNEGFYNALVQVLNEPAGIIHFGVMGFFNTIVELLGDFLTAQLASDKTDVVKHYVEHFDIMQQFCFFRTTYADWAINYRNDLYLLGCLVGIHQQLIDAYYLSTRLRYDNNDVFSVSWYNFTNIYVLSIVRMSRFVLAANIPRELSFEQLGVYRNQYIKNYCIKDCYRYYFCARLEICDPTVKNDNFQFICYYLDAFYFASILHYSGLTVRQLFELWGVEIAVDAAIEAFVHSILNFFVLRLKIQAGDIEKQNLYEFQAIVRQQEQLIYFNQVIAEQLFTLRVLLLNHSQPLPLLRRYFEKKEYLLQFLHQLLFYPQHTDPDYMKCILVTTGKFNVDDEVNDAVLNSTRFTPQEIMKMGIELVSRQPIIMGDDKIIPNDMFYEYSVNLGLFDDILMQRIHKKYRICTARFCKPASDTILTIITGEFMEEIAAALSDNIEYSLYLIIYRIMVACDRKNIALTYFLRYQLESSPDANSNDSNAVCDEKSSLSSRKRALLMRVGYSHTDSLLLGQFQRYPISQDKICYICHQAGAGVAYFPCLYEPRIEHFSYCSHVFHKPCLEQIMRSRYGTCPICAQAFNVVQRNFTHEQTLLGAAQYSMLTVLKAKNRIVRSELASYCNQLQRFADSRYPNQTDNFAEFFHRDTEYYIQTCASPRICAICQKNIEICILQCPKCLKLYHGTCVSIINGIVHCSCGHCGLFCIDRLQYVLSPFLVYQVPYKDRFGKMTDSVYGYVKDLDYDSLEKLALLIIRRTPQKLSRQTLESYLTAFRVSQETVDEYSDFLMHLGLINMFELLDAEGSDVPNEV